MIERIKAVNYRCFETLDFTPHEHLNILVGNNESGKSTLLEVISLAITGRVNGRWAADEVNPRWFNHGVVSRFFDDIDSGEKRDFPEIEIEVFFAEDTEGAARLRGLHNSRKEDLPGLRLRVLPNPEYTTELNAYLAQKNLPPLMPTDLFMVEWQSFAGDSVTRQPKGLGVATVNSKTASGSSGVDYKLRQLLRDFVEPRESAKLALEYRRSRHELSQGMLEDVNVRIAKEGNSFGVNLSIDQSSGAGWESSVTPHIGQTPFPMLGQGRQVATKVSLAMSRSSNNTRFVLVEEPENHLSHTELQKMISVMQGLANGRQLFITTHSSFVLNRLGFDSLQIMWNSEILPLSTGVISEDTINYFRKQSGFDTLRLAIAGRVVVVEGPSDEMIFNAAYKEVNGVEPRDEGVDVIALGTRGKRALELAKALGKKVAVLRDNDGKPPSHWRTQAGDLIDKGLREMFIGEIPLGTTLEPQMISAGNEAVLSELLGVADGESVENHMLGDKTEWAWKVSQNPSGLKWPQYMRDAIDFIDAD